MSEHEETSARSYSRPWVFWGGAAFVIGLIALMVAGRMGRAGEGVELPAFSQQVDLSPLDRIAVQSQGRVKSFRSFTTDLVSFIAGNRVSDPRFLYFDLLFRPEAYDNAFVIYVKSKPLRKQLYVALEKDGLDADAIERFAQSGYLPPVLLERGPSVREVLNRLKSDAIGAAKHVQAIESALELRKPQRLAQNLLMLPPAGDDASMHWASLALVGESEIVPDATSRAVLSDAWGILLEAWQDEDATRVNTSIEILASTLPVLNQSVYPSQSRLGWESWYYANSHMTWVWLVYMLAVILLLLGVVYRWPGAHWSGAGVFILALALHTAAVGLRWYVSGRWPNSNMFEAVTTSAWFGSVFVIVVELFLRRSPMRGLFFLAAAVSSMAALMSAHLLPVDLNPSVGTMMPILHDVWLYIHTNVIIFSYVLIAMASVTSLLYLLHRAAGGERDYARMGGTGALLSMTSGTPSKRAVTMPIVLDGVTMVLMELAFVLLWAGLVMGAIWADHSWGRPWGWDPKEVFALNTFIVFVLLIHVRMMTRDKGMWTAVLAILGCGAMLFNWIVINFIISGLHSYA